MPNAECFREENGGSMAAKQYSAADRNQTSEMAGECWAEEWGENNDLE
jgi:hypothetical protein